MPNITLQKKDHTIRDIMFFILGAVILIGPDTWYWLLQGLRPNVTAVADAQTMRQIPASQHVSQEPMRTRQAGAWAQQPQSFDPPRIVTERGTNCDASE